MFQYKTNGDVSPQGKRRVYFTCHPEDYELFFEKITDEILKNTDCAIWYTNDKDYEDINSDLGQMNLFVIPITTRLLIKPCRAMQLDVPFALENHIPILPLMQEGGLDELFTRYFGDLQYLDPNSHDITAISYEDKLKKYLNSVFIKNKGGWIFISHSSNDIQKVRIIRNEFEKYGQNPLAFHLKCLNDETDENKRELCDLIKREISVRDWFVYCESPSAKNSLYVKMERDYVNQCNKQFIWEIDLDQNIESIKEKIKNICTSIQVYVLYSQKDVKIVTPLMQELKKSDFQVWDNKMMINDSFFDVKEKGFLLFICTQNTLINNSLFAELSERKKNGATIIALVFDVVIPENYIKVIGFKNIYFIPVIPKNEDMYLLVDLLKNALKRKIVGAIQSQADALNAEQILYEKLNYNGNYHSRDAICKHVGGACDDYIETYEFPCCGKTVVVGDGPVSKFRIDGCCSRNIKTKLNYTEGK